MFKPNYLSLAPKCKFVSSRSLFDKICHRNIENTDLFNKLRQSTWKNYDMKKPRNYSPSYFKQEIPSTKYEQVRYVNLYETNSEPLLMPVTHNPVINDPKKEITSKESDEEFLPPINEDITSREEDVEEFLPMDKYEVADYNVDASQNLEEEEFLPMNEENIVYEGLSPNVHDYKTPQSLLDSNKIIKRRYIENDYDEGNRIIPENKNNEIVYIEEKDEENVIPARKYNIIDSNEDHITINPVQDDSDYTLYNEYDINEEFVPTRRYKTPCVDSKQNTSYVIEEEEEEEGENVTPEKAYDGVITVYEDEYGNTFIPKNINEYDELDDESYIPDSRYVLNKDDDGDDFIPARRCEEIVSTRYLKDSNQEITPQAYDEDETENYENKRFIHLHPVIGSN